MDNRLFVSNSMSFAAPFATRITSSSAQVIITITSIQNTQNTNVIISLYSVIHTMTVYVKNQDSTAMTLRQYFIAYRPEWSPRQ